MSIIDTFFIMFEADTKGIEKGLKDGQKQADKFTQNIKSTEKATNGVVDAIGSIVAELGAAVVAGLTISGVFKDVTEAANFGNKIGRFSRAIGENTATVAAWGSAVQMAGGTAAGFNGSLASLTNDFQNIALTGNSAALPFLARLGISVFKANGHIKNAIDILPQLATAFHKMPKAEAMAYGQHLGLSIGTIMLLQKGRKAVVAQVAEMKRLNRVNKASTDLDEKYANAVNRTKIALRGVSIAIGNDILPALIWFNKKITEVTTFMQQHKTMAEAFFVGIGSAISIYLLPILASLATTVVIAAAPFLLIAAAVTAFGVIIALVTNDIHNFLEGNKSVIGLFFDKYPKALVIAKEFIKGFREGLSELIHLLEAFFNALMHPIDAIKKLKAETEGLFTKGFKEGLNELIHLLEIFFNALMYPIDAIKKLKDETAGLFKSGWKDTKHTIEHAWDGLFNINTPPPFKTLGSATSSGDNNITQQIHINISSTEPHEAAKQVKKVLIKEYNDAVARHNTGIKI